MACAFPPQLAHSVLYVNYRHGGKEARAGKQDAKALNAAIANEPENYLQVANIIL